jgi:anti-sigma regulatory factor (Ser/Thr protein kinase)
MTTTESGQQVIRSFRAHPSTLHQVRQFVRSQGRQAGLSQNVVDELQLAVSEACANSVLHADTRHVEVRWQLGESRVEVEVRDEGVFRRRVRIPEVDGSGGHGLPLMMALVDEFSMVEGTDRRRGTVVKLVKCFPG